MDLIAQVKEQIASCLSRNERTFAVLVRLPGDDAKSKALLVEAINNITKNVLPEMKVNCFFIKHHFSYDQKLKQTTFHSILYCEPKNKNQWSDNVLS